MLLNHLPPSYLLNVMKGTFWQLLMAVVCSSLTYAYNGNAQDVLNRRVSLSA
jgi:hypothetical protein